jgi:hypothetical protein
VISILRALCSVAFLVLLCSATTTAIRSEEFSNRRYDVAVQRTELFAPFVTTAVSPDGHTIAIARSSGSFEKRNGRVELWDSTSGALERVINGFDGPIWSMSFSKDGSSLITVSTEFRKPKTQPSHSVEQDPQTTELNWWDVHSGEFLRKELLGSEGIKSVEASWSPAGDVLAVVERYPRGHWVPVVGQQMVSSGWVNSVELKLGLFDAHSLETRTKIEGDQQTVTGEPAFTALARGAGNESVYLWTVRTGKLERILR